MLSLNALTPWERDTQQDDVTYLLRGHMLALSAQITDRKQPDVSTFHHVWDSQRVLRQKLEKAQEKRAWNGTKAQRHQGNKHIPEEERQAPEPDVGHLTTGTRFWTARPNTRTNKKETEEPDVGHLTTRTRPRTARQRFSPHKIISKSTRIAMSSSSRSLRQPQPQISKCLDALATSLFPNQLTLGIGFCRRRFLHCAGASKETEKRRTCICICIYSISYHIISCHVISYHVMSYHIISYHILSDLIKSYHIISYPIVS